MNTLRLEARGLVLFGPRRPLRRSLAYLAALAAAAVWVVAVSFDRAPLLPADIHARTSLEMAVNRVFCGLSSSVSPGAALSARLGEDPAAVTVPLESLARQTYGPWSKHCPASQAGVNNENTLMLLAALWLRLSPHGSLADLNDVHLVLKLAGLFVLLLAMLDAGVSVLFATLTGLLGLYVLLNLEPWSYTQYGLLPPILWLTLGLYALALPRLRGLAGCVTFGVAAGAWTACGANLRTSYLPALLLSFGLFALARAVTGRRSRTGAEVRRELAPMLIGFVVGYAGVHLLLIRPLVPADPRGRGNFTYHTVFHPLVLSLAVPPNPLSQREGIEWNDRVGEALARRKIASASYLRPGYERALARYYFGLWWSEPLDMLSVYGMKLDLAGRHMARYIDLKLQHGSGVFRILLWPFAQLPSGAFQLAAFGALVIMGGHAHLRSGSAISFMVGLFGGIAFLMHLESVIIMPYFQVPYHSFLLFSVSLVGVSIPQALLEGAARLVGARGVPAE